MVGLIRLGRRRLADLSRWLFVAAVAITVADGAALLPGSDRDAATSRPTRTGTSPGAASSKTDTLYLSTFTRAGGLLLGAAFAMVWRPVALMRGPMRDQGRAARRARRSSASPGSRLLMLVARTSSTPEGADPWLFRGGFFVTASPRSRSSPPSPTSAR